MLMLQACIVLASLVTFATPVVKHMTFKNNFNASAVHTDQLLFDSPARSKLACFQLCAVTPGCVRFTYTGTRGTPGGCQGYFTLVLPPGQGTSIPDASTYVWTGLRPISGELSNVALNKTAVQSTTGRSYRGFASVAVDGDTNPDLKDLSCTETKTRDINWWQVDLAGDVITYDIVSVIITNRGDCCWERLQDFDVHVYSEDPIIHPSASATLCHHYTGYMGRGATEELSCWYGPVTGRYLRVTNTPGIKLTLCECQVMAVPRT